MELVLYIGMPVSSPDRYRRPFLIQLTAAESDRLDRLGATRGSKRQALLDGLALLETGELETLRTRVAELEQERDQAVADARTAATAQAADGAGVRDRLRQATTQLRDERAAHRATTAELRQRTQDLSSLRRDLASTQRELAAAQDEARRLAARLPHQAFCGACGKLAPEAEWATQPAQGGGLYVYHQPHGWRPKATLTQGPSVLFWLATPRETAT